VYTEGSLPDEEFQAVNSETIRPLDPEYFSTVQIAAMRNRPASGSCPPERLPVGLEGGIK